MCYVYVLWQQHWFKFWSYFLILRIIIYVFNYKYIFLMKLWIKKNWYGIIKKTFVMTPVNCVLYFTFRLIFQKETFFSTILVDWIITDFSWSSFSLFLPSEYFEWDFLVILYKGIRQTLKRISFLKLSLKRSRFHRIEIFIVSFNAWLGSMHREYISRGYIRQWVIC